MARKKAVASADRTAARKAEVRKTAAKKPAPKRRALKTAGSKKKTAPAKPASHGGKTADRARVAKSSRVSKAELDARKAVIETALKMSLGGLSPGRSGNVSVRWGKGMLITPSGMAYDDIKPSDIVFVDGDGSFSARAKKPSSEWRFHLSAYQARPDKGAIVHTHSLHAVVLACAHKPIPAFHYMVALAGGDHIPLVPYAPFGTQELADYVAEGIGEIDACLMANHGQIALGNTLAQALELAGEVEILAEQYVKVLTLGLPRLLRRRQMQDVLERIKGYGQHAQETKKT